MPVVAVANIRNAFETSGNTFTHLCFASYTLSPGFGSVGKIKGIILGEVCHGDVEAVHQRFLHPHIWPHMAIGKNGVLVKVALHCFIAGNVGKLQAAFQPVAMIGLRISIGYKEAACQQ